MTAFALKLVAVAAMLVDHLAYTLYLAGQYPSDYMLMRAVGRIAFPIFAFMLANGLTHTSSRAKYLARMAAFAAVSQPFFALAFSGASYGGAPFASFDLLAPGLNVFFTLAVSLAVLAAFDALVAAARAGRGVLRAVGALVLAGLAAALILPESDYGFMGLLLTAGLYLARRSRTAQAAVIVLWSFAEYAMPVSSWWFVVGAAAAGAAVLLYNGRRGARARWIYAFYPAHLAALWALCRILSR